MGESDIESLHKIYEQIKLDCKEYNLPYHFKVDDGSFETAIEFTAIGYHHPPKSKSWDESKKNDNEIKCPDLLDYTHKIIIELEEESKPGHKMGKLGKKGHTPESEKDSHRDYLYRISGIELLKIWESDFIDSNAWKSQLSEFLIKCKGNKS